jgi:RimJ/RimL family protein N-acetyltransferase
VEACRAFIEAAFRETTARAIVADIDPRNHASIAVAERLGLSRERLIVGNVTIKGELCDTLIMRLERPT